MKPFGILIFSVAVFALLLGISVLVPADGIKVTDDLNLRFINSSEILRKDTVHYADITGMVNMSSITSDPESFMHSEIKIISDRTGLTGQHTALDENMNDSKVYESRDKEEHSKTKFSIGPETFSGESETITYISNPHTYESAENRAIPVLDVDSLKKFIQPLEFTNEGRSMLFSFFESIDEVKDGEIDQIRILHYGDSQIESDRMTSLIRFRLQQEFGGYGCGLVSALPLYEGNPAFTAKPYGDFRRVTIFGRRDAEVNHNSYGVLGCFTSLPESKKVALPALEYQFKNKKKAGQFDRIKLYLHSYNDSANIIFTVNGTVSDTLGFIGGGFNILNYRPHTPVEKLILEFDFQEGGRLYGISFESDHGIQMDNIAMRGSSGLVFSKMDPEVLKDMMNDLRVGLLIMQFGGNVVPYIKDSRYYKKKFSREIDFLREICPAVPIIVIGPSDMSVKENGRFVTHPSLEPVRTALKDAAIESGLIFWDLYEAMGGYNSMPSFVNANPPLARPDYVHFSYGGANFMAEMFYNALMLEYRKYKTVDSRQLAVGGHLLNSGL